MHPSPNAPYSGRLCIFSFVFRSPSSTRPRPIVLSFPAFRVLCTLLSIPMLRFHDLIPRALFCLLFYLLTLLTARGIFKKGSKRGETRECTSCAYHAHQPTTFFRLCDVFSHFSFYSPDNTISRELAPFIFIKLNFKVSDHFSLHFCSVICQDAGSLPSAIFSS